MRRESWGVDRLLTVWGLYECGGNFTNPWGGGSNGDVDANQDEVQAARYVEATPRFQYARPALVWLYVKGHDTLKDFGQRLPFETWQAYRHRLGLPKASPTWEYDVVAEYVQFMHELAARCRKEPFVPVLSLSEYNPWVGDQIESQKKSGNSRPQSGKGVVRSIRFRVTAPQSA